MKKAKMLLLLFTLFIAMTLTSCGAGGSSGSSDNSSEGDSNSSSDDSSIEGEEAAFIATAKIDVLSETDLEYMIIETFPVGMGAEITYTVQPNQTYSPIASDLAEESQTENTVDNTQIAYSNITEDSFGAVDSFEFNLSYFLPYDAFPDDVAAQLQGLSSVSKSSVNKKLYDSQSGVKVVGKGIMNSAGKKAVENMLKQGFGETPGKVIGKTGGGALDVISAWDTHNEHSDWMERLDKLEDCVENPSNPLDQKTYQENPTLKQQHLDKINATRTEIKLNTGVKFINKIVSGASSLTPARALWPIISGAKSYTDDAMKQINESRVKDLEKELPKCNSYYTGWLRAKVTTIDYEDEEEIQEANFMNITWNMATHVPGDFTQYNMSSNGTVEVIKRGAGWEETCDPVDKYLNNIPFEGKLFVYDANRSDQYDNKYAFMVYPTKVTQNITATCDHDGDPDTPRIEESVQIALGSYISSCGWSKAPDYNPLGTPFDMPQYSSVALLEGSNMTWACEELPLRANWLFELTQVVE